MDANRLLTCYRPYVALSLAAMGWLYSEVRCLRGYAEGYHAGVSAAVSAWQEPPGRGR